MEDKLPKEILAAKKTLFGCIANKGFLQRLVTQFMPKLRSNTEVSSLIKNWEKKICQEEDLRVKAYKELSGAFKKIKIVLAELEKQMIKRMTIFKHLAAPALNDGRRFQKDFFRRFSGYSCFGSSDRDICDSISRETKSEYRLYH